MFVSFCSGTIGSLKPNWTDEMIYQETRRIVIGEYQRILYEEWLPSLLGSNLAESVFVGGTTKTKYDPNLNPSVLNEVVTACHRFGHTLLDGDFNRNDPFTGNLLDFFPVRFALFTDSCH